MFENKVDNCKVKISDNNKCVLYNNLIFIITYQICDDYHCRGINFIDNDKFSTKFTKFRRNIGPGVYIMDVSSVFVNQ